LRLPAAVLVFFGLGPAMKVSFQGDGIHYSDFLEWLIR